MAAKRKANTKQDLENKIAELEAKLNKLSTQLVSEPAEAAKPAEVKPAEAAKPKEAPKPAEVKPAAKSKGTLPKGFGDKPAESAKPKEAPKPAAKSKGTLPKGFGDKPAESAKPKEAPKPAEVKPAAKSKGTLPKGFEDKPAEAPKPAETTSQPPATVQEALEDAYYTAPMTSFHDYRAKVTGYAPAPNRYFVRRTAPVGKVPTSNWNDQKATVSGYTAASNQYFATRARMAFHPADKTFGSFSGNYLTVEGVKTQTQTKQAPPPEAPKPAKGTLPKGMEQTTQQVSSTTNNADKSKKQQLEEYENDYLKRIEQERIEDEKAYQESVAAEAKAKAQQTRGVLPKGFESKPEPEPPKASRGTLPKGF